MKFGSLQRTNYKAKMPYVTVSNQIQTPMCSHTILGNEEEKKFIHRSELFSTTVQLKKCQMFEPFEAPAQIIS